MTSPGVGGFEAAYAEAIVEHTGRQVPLVATTPAQRATRRARPVVLLLGVLVVLVALALLFLATGPTLSATMASALLALAVLVVALHRASGPKKSLQGASLALRVVVGAEVFVIGGSAIHYFISLLLAPLLGEPESPPATLLWALLTGIPVAVFLAWATSPIKPRPPKHP